MRIAHRKQVWIRDHAWWDSAVDLFSGLGGYCHTELIFSNGESFTSTTDFIPSTAVYPRIEEQGGLLGIDDENGEPIKRKNGPLIRRISFPDWEWEFTDLNVTDSQELQVYAWCKQTIDESIADKAGYDWAGVLRFVIPFLKEHKKDWFCTESVVAAVQQIGLFPDVQAWRMSPNRFRKMCRQLEAVQ